MHKNINWYFYLYAFTMPLFSIMLCWCSFIFFKTLTFKYLLNYKPTQICKPYNKKIKQNHICKICPKKSIRKREHNNSGRRPRIWVSREQPWLLIALLITERNNNRYSIRAILITVAIFRSCNYLDCHLPATFSMSVE